MKVGFIGLGKMGKPMAINLLKKGFELTVHNRSRGVVDALSAMGAKAANSPREVVEASEIVLTCLPTPAAVEMVFLGKDGLIPSVKPGQILVDHSTVSPTTSRKLHAAAAEKGAYFLDAPISGGVPRAEAATLTVMVGGEAEAFERAKPVFDGMGNKVVLVGGPGVGSVVKLVNQLLVGIHTAAAVEALVFGVKAGADPRVLLEIIDSSFGASAMFSRTVPMVLARQFASATDVGILSKDMGLITRFGKELSTRLLLGAVAEQVFDEGVGLGLANQDMSSLVLPLEKIAGVEVK
ncbi:MAG: NAD(P)-dependent oxidoreductase [Chloroflexota bacterium]|jgi:3-hydroxyisobutyrate dehydrogenase-like beta-hydroxyacid dehydrogenase